MATVDVAQSITIGNPTASVVGNPHECGLVPSVGCLPPNGTTSAMSGRAVRVGDVATPRSFHDVAAAPEVVRRIVHADRSGAEFISQPDAFLDRPVGDRLAELVMGVPTFAALNRDGFSSICAPGTQPPVWLPNNCVQMQGLDGIVGADAVAGRILAEPRGIGGFVGQVTALLKRRLDERVVEFDRNDVVGL